MRAAREQPFRKETGAIGYSCLRHHLKEVAMSADNKTSLDHVNDTLTQLKEMRHYSKNNVERLTTHWLLFDSELKKLKQADRIEDLMVRAGELHEAIEAEIAELEEVAVSLQPAADEGGTAGTLH
jgi:septation ring formation regulator EzrA